ncbi:MULTISPECIES: MmcQ/YjbR family DNA-binding protein [unclassified Sphingobacterium]|uniref:MmcQ/YjbR family DNA-binding protein n=1 Tax=unclassified Sphingobacterium TaxID=2609468 RepID=UPI001AE9FD80|nr:MULTISPECIES: MmcQ/YjbR family DNA-binding protein [unclassified Sphingobacterium]MDR6736304.1 putative DNA-binding protein (MmcQ/YjbR family) [Sphingobacterium sp. 2149]
MNIEDLRDYCLSIGPVVEETPFGPDTLVFKIGGKIFLLVGLDQIDELRFNVKCNPERAIELREKYEHTVLPGYHMNKKHWNTIIANRELEDKILEELIVHSYSLIVESLPTKLKQEIKGL